jgi:DNA-binding NarL/FixJ family response regulator
MSIRVLLADNQALVRAGFRMILEAQPDIEVVGEAADCDHAICSARRLRPDVVVMDARTLRTDEVNATRQLVADGSRTRVLILATVDRDEYVHAMIRAGASGFILKDVQPAQLVEAVRVVARGEALLAPSVARRLLERLAQMLPASSAPPQLSSLSRRELEVLRLLATGLSNAELAKRLFLAEATVKTHLSSVLRKLERRDRVQAVILAYEAGLVRPAWPDQAVAPPRHRSTQPLAGCAG